MLLARFNKFLESGRCTFAPQIPLFFRVVSFPFTPVGGTRQTLSGYFNREPLIEVFAVFRIFPRA